MHALWWHKNIEEPAQTTNTGTQTYRPLIIINSLVSQVQSDCNISTLHGASRRYNMKWWKGAEAVGGEKEFSHNRFKSCVFRDCSGIRRFVCVRRWQAKVMGFILLPYIILFINLHPIYLFLKSFHIALAKRLRRFRWFYTMTIKTLDVWSRIYLIWNEEWIVVKWPPRTVTCFKRQQETNPLSLNLHNVRNTDRERVTSSHYLTHTHTYKHTPTHGISVKTEKK